MFRKRKLREELVNDPNKESLFDFPDEIIQYIPHANHADLLETSRMMSTLSKTCKTIHFLFKPALEQHGAQQLIAYLLYPDEAAKKASIKIAEDNPGLFFIKLPKIIDHAKDLEGNHRFYKDWSAYPLLFLGDVDLLACVKPHLDVYLDQKNQVGNVTHDHEFAHSQVLEKFPDGFDFPPCTEEFTALLADLATAITGDQHLIQTRNPSAGTLALLKKLREHYKPGVVKTGHPFNMNDMIKVHEVYDQNLNLWNEKQLRFFSVNIIGLLTRFMTQGHLLRVLQGLVNQDEPLVRSYKVMNHVSGKEIMLVPFDSDPSCRLGAHFLIDSYYGRRGEWRVRSVAAGPGALQNYVKQTHQRYQNLCGAESIQCNRRV